MIIFGEKLWLSCRLTRERVQLSNRLWVRTLCIRYTLLRCKNPQKMTGVLRPFLLHYSHFTRILAYSMVYIKKSNDDISNWDFAHPQIGLFVSRISWKFQLKRIFSSRVIEVPKITHIPRKMLEFSVLLGL